MSDEPDARNAPPPVPPPPDILARSDSRLLRLISDAEHGILYLVSITLLVIAVGILIQLGFTIVRTYPSWPEVIIVAVEELLLVLIVLEIFVTVLTHLHGGRLLLEPFIIVGIVAVVRHILSVVVRHTIPLSPNEGREQLIELAVYAGAAFLLSAALALSRWSRRWPGEPHPAHPIRHIHQAAGERRNSGQR
jgi:uncharacterized membrane protein (DUF373 family)